MRLIAKISACLLAVATLSSAFTASAQVAREKPSRVVFSRSIVGGQAVDRTLETYSWGTQTLPAHRIATANIAFLHYTLGTDRPKGAATQSLSFRFRSNGLFAANPDAHFAAVGRAEGTSWGNRGRGFIVGGLYDKPNPCATGIRSQPETWWTNQATMQGHSAEWDGPFCGAALSDNVWYDAYIHINSNSGFIYEIKQGGTLVGGGTYIVDNLNQENALINEKPTGFILALVEAKNLSASWSLEFDSINVGWF